MARAPKGILGPFFGKVANVEGYMSRGQFLMRSKRKKSTVPPSEKQKAYRQQFSLVCAFIQPLTDFVRVGFEREALDTVKTANNLARAYQMSNAIAGTYPDVHIDYSKVVLTSGQLPMSKAVKVERIEGALRFSWKRDEMLESGRDQVMLVIYPHGEEKPICVLSGARRSEEQHIEKIMAHYEGQLVETWLSFISDDRKSIATSIYTGAIQL